MASMRNPITFMLHLRIANAINRTFPNCTRVNMPITVNSLAFYFICLSDERSVMNSKPSMTAREERVSFNNAKVSNVFPTLRIRPESDLSSDILFVDFERNTSRNMSQNALNSRHTVSRG
jgi:hypothetical protein